MASYKIFGYGSLMNEASLRRTVPEARCIIPAKTFGLRRVFNLPSHYRFDREDDRPVCVLNVEKAEKSVLNGVCFEMDELSLQNILEREKGYEFCKMSARHYFEKEQIFDAYYFRAKRHQPYRYLANSAAQRHYLDLCLQGSQAFGDNFVEDFKSSTIFWGIDKEQQLEAIWKGVF